MVPMLTVIADAVGMLGGAIISTMQLKVASSVYWNNVVAGLYMEDIWMGLIKPVVLGFALVTIGCHVGLRTKGGTQGVGRATTNAVVAGSVAVLALDFLVTKLLITLLYLMPWSRQSHRRLIRAGPARRTGGESPVVVFDRVSLAFDEKVILTR